MSADPAPGPINLVAFRLGGRLFGVDIMQVHKVLTGDDPLVPAPGAPAHVQGMIELQGALVAVLDLARLLGFEASAPRDESGRRVVVRRADRSLAALPADEVLGRQRLEVDGLLPPPDPVAGTAPIRGAFHREQELGLLLDVERLLAGA